LKVSPGAIIMAAANKADLESSMNADDIQELALALGTGFLRTSAKTGDGVEGLFLTLGRGIMEMRK
jgi:hypothetical protein